MTRNKGGNIKKDFENQSLKVTMFIIVECLTKGGSKK